MTTNTDDTQLSQLHDRAAHLQAQLSQIIDQAALAADEAADVSAEVERITTTAPATPARLLNVEQAAEALSLGQTMVRELIAKGEIRSITIGTARRIPVEALDEFIARQSEAAMAEAA